MINLSPSGYRNVDDGERPMNTKKIYSRRPWYALPVDPSDLVPRHQDNSAYDIDYNGQEEQYYDPNQDYVDPVTSRHANLVEQLESSPPNSRLEQGPTVGSVSESSIGNAINLREVALVALGGASAALVLLIVMAGVFVARRRKNSPSPAPSPPILVYPPHDIAGPCYMTKEVNFSLPALRSSSLGELREVASVSSADSEVLCPPVPPQLRSNSFTNTADLGVLDPALYKSDCLDEDLMWPEGHVGRVWFTLKYESSTERLQVHIMKAKHLPSRTPALANACDPYIKIQLMPDERRVLQTKQKKKTCNPFFDESFVYQIPPGKVEGLTLKLSVLDLGGVGKGKQLIGHIILPLSELEGVSPDEEPQLYKLDIEKELQEPTSDLGEVLVSLLYNENLHRLTVTVIEARALKLDPSSNKREMVVRVTQERACRGVRARRTAAVEVGDDGSALVSECFHFRLRADELHTTSVTVQALQPHSVYAKDRLLGKFVLGSYMFARGRALQHWNSALASPMEQVQQWHPLTH
ncbi:synaptotagmin-15-like [Achroia grisella]|uniref:synaptotagmin-15-like n=1 Tax=Achroia grisella TaxID=688607 RepID=UPI0027D22AB2|nr:synaptotagmin-15-like [Achroia grisella]XP_059052695.1 synaptotagmin-15-like [Achroia grisella]